MTITNSRTGKRNWLTFALVTSVSLFGLQPASGSEYPNCSIIGTSASETITGTDFADVICSGGGDDIVNGLSGNDIIIVQDGGNVTLSGGEGADVLDATAASSATIDAGLGDDSVYGSPGSDVISAGDGSDSVTAGDGLDTITGGDGDDNLSGGSGDDVISGELGDDTIQGEVGDDQINGGLGNDNISAGEGDDSVMSGYGDDTVTGGLGNDNLVGDAGNDNLSGDSGSDTISGGVGNDSLSGGEGNDEITGESGSDSITGGEGNDNLSSGDGNDYVDGDGGDDTISGGNGDDDIYGGSGNDEIYGGVGEDELNGEGGIDNLNGNFGDDSLIGGEASDELAGGDGADNLEGNAGDDVLQGESGQDTLSGSEGNDTLIGGSGVDSLSGGLGLNICDYDSDEVRTTSCKYDDSGPAVSNLLVSSEKIDVSSSDQTLYVTGRITDVTGVAGLILRCTASVETTFSVDSYMHVVGDKILYGHWNSSEQVPLEDFGNSRLIDFKFAILIPKGTKPASYTCSYSTQDFVGNGGRSSDLLNFFEITRDNPDVEIDDSAPQLKNFTLSRNEVVINDEPTLLTVSGQITDQTGIERAAIVCSLYQDGRWINAVDFRFYVRVSDLDFNKGIRGSSSWGGFFPSMGDKNLINFSYEIELGKNLPSGTYNCFAEELRDSINNKAYSGPVQGQLNITNLNTIDIDGPTVRNFEISRSIVDVGSSAASIEISADVSDLTGVAWLSVNCASLTTPNGTFDALKGWGKSFWDLEISENGTEKAFSFLLKLPINFGLKPGEYTCNLFLQDKLENQTSVSTPLRVLRTPAGLPTEPIGLNFSFVTPTSGVLSWQEPEFLGSPKLTGYEVQYSFDSYVWMELPSGKTEENQIRINNLEIGKKYFFRVLAVNGSLNDIDQKYVSLSWSDVASAEKLQYAPSAPSSLNISQVSNQGFRLNWLAPAENGGSQITNFNVEVSRNSGQSWQPVKIGQSTSTSLTISGASPGTTYLIRVSAVNAVGYSKYLTGTVTTLAIKAKAPKNLFYKDLTESTVFLGWLLPDSNGGNAIIDYQVEVSSNGSTSWVAIPHVASNRPGFKASNLLPGRTYQFRVSAVTSAGVGASSNIVTFTTLGAVAPKAPDQLSVSNVKTTSVSLLWSKVTATQKVTNYLIDLSRDGITWTPVSKKISTSNALAISGLRLGTRYQVRIAAVNSSGIGEHVLGSFTTLALMPSAPRELITTELTSSTVNISWTSPAFDGGSSITGSDIQIIGGSIKEWMSLRHDMWFQGLTGPQKSMPWMQTGEWYLGTAWMINNLEPGTQYRIRVIAGNAIGLSKPSSAVTFRTLALAPKSPSDISVKSVGFISAVVTWTAPDNGGAKISDYLVEYSTDNGQTWRTVVKSVSTSTTLTLKGLKTGTGYLVRVTAKNIVGYGAASQNLYLTTS